MTSAALTRFVLGASLGMLVTLAGCTASGVRDLPDVVILLDGGSYDTGLDAGFPDPTIDTCMDPGNTIGTACSGAEECDDGCFCNGVEACTGGECVAGADPCENELGPDGLPRDLECTDEACLEETDACFHMANHARCSDGLACNGYEQCDRRVGCVAAAPLYCNDESSCTVDSCDDGTGCVFTPRDLDGDGFIAGTPCDGDDCDDDPRFGVDIHPGATEVCDNRRDDDCDGRRDFSDSDCVPTNDTCSSATVLPARSGTYSGSTAGLSGDHPLACSTASGPDAVFRFHLDEPHDVRLAVIGIASASIGLRDFTQCESGPEIECTGTSPASVIAHSLPAGDYAIIVRTAGGGAFDLQMMITDATVAPPIDLCNAGTLAITASGRYTGRFEETGDDYSLTCHASTDWRDAVYRLELAADSDVELTASTTSAGSSSTYLALTTDCASAGATLTCTSAGSATFRRRGLAAGTYFIVIESSAAAAVEWALDVAITTPPAPRQVGDACATAIPIALSGSTGTATAMLTGAEGDGGTGCGGSAVGFRDVYFSFTLPETRDVTITTSAGTTTHYASLQTSCGSIGSELRCRSSSAPLGQVFLSLPAGTYTIAVATAAATGTVTADVETRPPTPIPPHDRCDGASVLTDGAVVYGTLVGLEDDAVGAVGTGNPDAFYTFTLAERRRVTILGATLTTPGPTTYLTLRAACDATTNLGAATGTTGTAALVTTLDPGSYIVFIEMPAASVTGYSIDFRTAAPPPP